jgi:murein DD-endopeptidase MepM/ murein hydrolase activator NlpD
MADGVVIRIVDNFSWSYFDQIKKWVGLSAFDKAKNLDIFRWNQVWLKMIDGNVVFYSHLSAIQDGLYVGKKIQSGDTLGKIWISGVPDKDYKNTHLHFEIAVNPLNSKNSPAIKDEIIMWPYLGKSLDKKQALSLQEKLFHGWFMAKK